MTVQNDGEPADVLEYWDNYLAEQRQKLEANADQLQTLVDELGLVEAGVNPLDPMFKLENIPQDAIDFLEREFGSDLRATDEAIKDSVAGAKRNRSTKQRRPMQRI